MLFSVSCYDFITVGAFTAFAQKYKQGGLLRQIKAFNDLLPEETLASAGAGVDVAGSAQKVGDTVGSLRKLMNSVGLLQSVIEERCNALCQFANQGNTAELRGCMQELGDKVCH